MRKNQDLFYVTQAVLEKTKEIFLKHNPCLVIVHGDTTTTMAAALSAFYLHIPIAHVEAGLRTGNMNAPFPEEMNRKVVGQIATFHFTPTAFSTANMLSEGVARENVFCTGNTIVDALNLIREKIEKGEVTVDESIKKQITQCKQAHKKIVLLTAHRRESFDGGLSRIFTALAEFLEQHPNVIIFYPVHPNPNVKKAIEESDLKNSKNVLFLPPLPHTDLIYLLMNSSWVITDSGGIQEEAVSLGKMVLVLRDVTERCEGVWEGTEILVGTDEKKIKKFMSELYNHAPSNKPSYIYGDGNACEKIATILRTKLEV